MSNRLKDHREIGRELDLFTTSDLVGSGLPLFTPKGTILRDILSDYSEKLQKEAGYEKVWIPHIAKEELYKNSGHWDKFGNELFKVKSQETNDKFILKPMNCPHHIQIYTSRPRSYKDLPVRFYETTTVYRDEKSGELGGLLRVRSVTQDDAHIFCTMEQIDQELFIILDMVKKMYKALDMEFKLRLSFKDQKTPEKYFGTDEQWNKAQESIERVAKKSGLKYEIAIGEAAFYAPKIDIMVTDSQNREWQLATEQVDLVMPSRFKITYLDSDGNKKNPIMIHKALLGSIERFLSVYLEHTQGNFPLWISPVQVKVIPISEKHNEFAKQVFELLKENSIRSEFDKDNSTVSLKIRNATLQKIPYMFIIGDKEIEKSKKIIKLSEDAFISVRTREGKDLGFNNLYEFIQSLKKQIGNFL
jgi:threonyl-tRNA synthetase